MRSGLVLGVAVAASAAAACLVASGRGPPTQSTARRAVSAEEARTLFVLADNGLGKGCQNWRDIKIGDFIWPIDLENCRQRCAEEVSCTGFNFQTGSPLECNEHSGHSSSCLLLSGDCQQESNQCWSLYHSATPAPIRSALGRTCSGSSESCWGTRCCSNPSEKCYAKDLGWAQCLETCTTGEDRPDEAEDVRTRWLCIEVMEEYGETEHAPAPASAPVGEEQSALPWVVSTCAEEGEYCIGKSCCGEDMKCFQKHPLYAACKKECEEGIDESEPAEEQTPWSCVEVSPEPPSGLGGESLFCFALLLPGSYEVGLMEAQLSRQAGVFACDASAVYSNLSIKLEGTPSVETQVVEGSLHCELGGVYDTALNSEIFVRVWKKVLSGPEFASHHWTVKADPDAVLLPARLKHHVANYKYLQGRRDSVFLNNCKDGLHGPIEVISRGGMNIFQGGIDKCVEAFKEEFKDFGEDVFLRHCLQHLGVGRADDFGLLKETHCDPFPGEPSPCTMGRVAFHPLKTPDEWLQCLAEASQEDAESQPQEEEPTPEIVENTASDNEHSHETPQATTSAPMDDEAPTESCEKFGGIPHFDQVTCCSADCGEYCGAPNCSAMGEEKCCGAGIPDSQACSEKQQAPCTLRKVLESLQQASAAEQAKRKIEGSHLKALEWQCMDYATELGAGNATGSEWCKNAGIQNLGEDGGVEYRFFGPETPCSPCWCCKRELVKPEEAPAKADESADKETTDSGYSLVGRGFCADESGQQFREYSLLGRPIEDCEGNCNGIPECLGFTYEVSARRCALHTPCEEPTYWGTWDDTSVDGRAGVGDIAGATSDDDARCFKRPWGHYQPQPQNEETEQTE